MMLNVVTFFAENFSKLENRGHRCGYTADCMYK